jgi:hypothetical protein
LLKRILKTDGALQVNVVLKMRSDDVEANEATGIRETGADNRFSNSKEIDRALNGLRMKSCLRVYMSGCRSIAARVDEMRC